ncbi:LOW QUALITY PROTEIN: G patch domain-containing protein 4 [Alosa alosa]|uniref:LOW QUALITY PROTEIN: G patch domain-containing protein 4 n=1 Tax=Alosa alosa TaxID=278164 RepID=UPI0020151DEE|nr:LOW QUALITY PROTEIN: G patch domain-containing protein 4 [Alosa alosa]
MAEAISEKSRGLTFAEQQMLRHGWQPGKGLGRHEDGRSEPIKVKVKCDKGGVGHKLGEQFTFNWWDHVFNKASSNLSVEDGQDGISMKKVNDEEENGMISNKRPLKAKLTKGMQYGCFVKSATLLCGQEQPEQKASSSDDSSDSEDEDQKLDLSSATNLSDAELLKVCGGRTAHKGARHGLTMSAKLARLEQQEREFMAKYGKKESSVGPCTEATTAPATQSPSNVDSVTKRPSARKTSKRALRLKRSRTVLHGDIDASEVTDYGRRQKKKKKKSSKERGDTDAAKTPVEASLEDQNTDDTQSKKKKKKKQQPSNQEMEESNKNECQEDFRDAINVASTEEAIADQPVDADGELKKALKKKRSKKNLSGVGDAAANGHHTDATHECEESCEVIAEVEEQCTVDLQLCIDVDSKNNNKKKKQKKSLKTKEDVPSLYEEGTQNEPREQVPDVKEGEEKTNRKSKAKKRKTDSENEHGFPHGDSTNSKKRGKKGKEER